MPSRRTRGRISVSTQVYREFKLCFCFSVSLSSLDSEEQESLRAAERLHNRTSRNSTGGISTHSLNEAELAVRSSQVFIDLGLTFSRINFSAILRRSSPSGTWPRRSVGSRCRRASRRRRLRRFAIKVPRRTTPLRKCPRFLR